MSIPKQKTTNIIKTSALFQQKPEEIFTDNLEKLRKKDFSGKTVLENSVEKIITEKSDNEKSAISEFEAKRGLTIKREDKFKNGKYIDRFSFNFPIEDRKDLKIWCMENNLTLADFILHAISYLKKDVDDGKVKVTKLGIRRMESK